MTEAENEIVANAGVQLREIAERLTVPASWSVADAPRDVFRMLTMMDAAALSISEVYGQLSALPLDTPATVAVWRCPACNLTSNEERFPESHHWWCPVVTGGGSA